MSYTNISQALDAMHDLERNLSAYNHAMGVLYLDASTAAPKDSFEGRGQTMAVLTQASYDLLANPQNEELLQYLEENVDALQPNDRRAARLLRREYSKLTRIPAEEYVAYNVLINDAQAVWETAKNNNHFALFQPYLEKIVDYNRRFAGYFDAKKKPYDALLNEYETGLTTETLDQFFETLRAAIVPLIAKISEAPAIDDSFLFQRYPVYLQRRLSDYLMEIMGIDRNHCAIAETEHPFTTNFNNKDVRITTHYYENNLVSSMYSVIHEGGHALYELGARDEFNYTALSGGVSMGIHESQSRFYENIIGRSRPFIAGIFPQNQEQLPGQLNQVNPEEMWRAVNKAQPSLIRTEADELTYCMHIMVRYELEKRLIDGTLKVADLPDTWNRLYQEYLGVAVPSDKEGCLQDSHWSGGMIGYFPSYALGSAYGAQMLCVMEQESGNFWEEVAKGDLSGVTAWLRTHIHQYASLYEPQELFEKACGVFDPAYYTDYLTKKYTALYGLA